MMYSISVITIAGLLAITVIDVMRPHDDNLQIIIQIIMYLTPTLAILLNMVKNQENAQMASSKADTTIEKLNTVHKDFQGRVDQLIDSTKNTATLVERAAKVDERLSDIKNELALNTELTKKIANGS
jgi:hypothetical protein